MIFSRNILRNVFFLVQKSSKLKKINTFSKSLSIFSKIPRKFSKISTVNCSEFSIFKTFHVSRNKNFTKEILFQNFIYFKFLMVHFFQSFYIFNLKIKGFFTLKLAPCPALRLLEQPNKKASWLQLNFEKY